MLADYTSTNAELRHAEVGESGYSIFFSAKEAVACRFVETGARGRRYFCQTLVSLLMPQNTALD